MPLSGSVLIIDDEPALRQTLARVLRQAGCDVASAADGPEALRRLEAASYDLAYLDIHLPGMDGLAVLQEIHRRHPELPVILFTAYASLQSALQAMRLGATDYLTKPIDPEAFVARTRVVLSEQAVLRRRRELQAQIASLQAELEQLKIPPTPPRASAEPGASAAPPASPAGDRFLKRGRFILDLQARRATYGERVLALPPAAFDYLAVLTRHAPDIVGYQTLVSEAQGYQASLRQAQELSKWHIHELREAVEADPRHPEHIVNVRGVGYRLVAD